MIKPLFRAYCVLLLSSFALSQATSRTVVFFEEGFPAVDTASLSQTTLQETLLGSDFSDAAHLAQKLSAPAADLLVLPYGSAFPEVAWPTINAFLRRGGNLLVIGGRPFTRTAYFENGRWVLRETSVRFSRMLLINDYQTVQTGETLQLVQNPETGIQLTAVKFENAFSAVMRLSEKDLYPQEGSAGSLDARIDPLVWADRSGDHVAAPVVAIDHLQGTFAGGRWIFVECDLEQGFMDSANGRELLAQLGLYALRGAEALSARPSQALFLPGEAVHLRLNVQARDLGVGARAEITIIPERASLGKIVRSVVLPADSVTFPTIQEPGLYRVETKFIAANEILRRDHSAFWVRDDEMLHSGPHFAASGDHFTFDGKPTAIVGTTYMSSDVQRQFLIQPNPYIWDRDMRQIADSGLNLLRTGLWSGWRDVTNDDGTAKESFLRNLEAYLLTARRHSLPVQFTFFSFLPESFGGVNPYLDPASIERQQNFIHSIVTRFKVVPYLSYDLINEPSISRFTWRTRPNGDKLELAAWNVWLHRKYPDWPALAEAWNVPALGESAPLPSAEEFAPRGAYFGNNGLKVHDYYLFAQDVFADWTRKMVGTIRAAGSKQLVTVGQDDGGYQERLNPAFLSDAIDFTTNHTWWLNDDLLWCSLIAKQSGKPMLIQETGLQRQLTEREIARLAPQAEATLLERKLALSFAGGAGAVEWLWNVNSYMTSDNEVTIGAVRADGTLKPDARLLRDFARFAAAFGAYLHDIEQPPVAIVTSQALQYSPWNSFANTAQQRAVRAMFYYAHIPAYIVAENQLASLGRPKLVVLPSPQVLSDAAWRSLLEYVRSGGHLLITGPVERDDHWLDVHRAAQVGLKAVLAPLTFHETTVKAGDELLRFDFGESAQENLEILELPDAANIETVGLGQGSITWVASPVELSEDLEAVGKLYGYVAKKIGLVRRFQVDVEANSGILVYPEVTKDAVLYIFVSESDVTQRVSVRDSDTGAKIEINLPAHRAALASVRRSDGKLVARYGF